MKIYTLWQHDQSEDVPWLIAACDEVTLEAHCGFPRDYQMKRGDDVREMVIEIPESAARALFAAPAVKGRVVP